MKRVRAGCKYRYHPGVWDSFDPPYGVEKGILQAGDLVRVVNLPGCPKANTMGHCHVNTLDGEFAGLVQVSSLERP